MSKEEEEEDWPAFWEEYANREETGAPPMYESERLRRFLVWAIKKDYVYLTQRGSSRMKNLHQDVDNAEA